MHNQDAEILPYMASEHSKVKDNWKSDRPTQTGYDVMCTPREFECSMKFSSKRIESPPPKPPRRRYSDLISVSSLGTLSNRKHNEETLKVDPKLKERHPESGYLSLPANLTLNHFKDYNDTSVLHSQSFNLFDQLEHSKESDCYGKTASGDAKLVENELKQSHLRNTEKFQEFDYDCLLQYGDSVSDLVDKLSPNSFDSPRAFMTDPCSSKNLSSFHKDRRHNSDPVLSRFHLQNGDVLHLDQEECCDKFSNRKKTKLCKNNESCVCCRKSHLFAQEIRILKETNEKLWQHLCSLLRHIESMRKNTFDEPSDISISGLLSSVYYAQKARDRAMDERLKIVLEEKDKAIQDYEDLIQVMAKSFDRVTEEESEKDIQELVSEIESTCDPSKLLKNQIMLFTQICKSKDVKQDSSFQQLKELEMERNSALDKVRQLEEEVKDLKMSCDIWHCDNKHWEFSIFEILNQVMHQRDSILSQMDNGLDLGNFIYWPPKGSLDLQNVSQFESCQKKIESIKNHLSDYKSTHSLGTPDEVANLKEEIFVLNKSLEGEMKKREMAEGKCVKLERLTHILRKKLNGQNVGVLV